MDRCKSHGALKASRSVSSNGNFDRLDLDQPADDELAKIRTIGMMHVQVHIIAAITALAPELAHQAVKAHIVAELQNIARLITTRRVAVLAGDHQELPGMCSVR